MTCTEQSTRERTCRGLVCHLVVRETGWAKVLLDAGPGLGLATLESGDGRADRDQTAAGSRNAFLATVAARTLLSRWRPGPISKLRLEALQSVELVVARQQSKHTVLSKGAIETRRARAKWTNYI